LPLGPCAGFSQADHTKYQFIAKQE